MSWAESHEAINNNQYGGRKGVQAQSAALNKTLTLDIIRYYAEPASIIDNDTQARYDRILIVLLCYSLLRLGLPLYLVKFMCRWLYQAQYRLKLNDRITEPYKWTTTCPLQGTGQGTGWSPPNWSSISDVITRDMDAHTPDICLVHPNRTNTHRTVDAFVDDTNSGLTTDGLHSFLPQPMAPVAKHDTIYD